jgi:plasmid stability protein
MTDKTHPVLPALPQNQLAGKNDGVVRGYSTMIALDVGLRTAVRESARKHSRTFTDEVRAVLRQHYGIEHPGLVHAQVRTLDGTLPGAVAVSVRRVR